MIKFGEIEAKKKSFMKQKKPVKTFDKNNLILPDIFQTKKGFKC